MSSPAEILAGLHASALGNMPLALAWHVLVLFGVVSMTSGWRPSQRLAALALSGPLATSSGVAFYFGNPFNGVLLAMVAAALFGLGVWAPIAPSKLRKDWVRFVGYLLAAFGFFYPHFLSPHPAGVYLLAAPLGVLPCPSLALAIGGALMLESFQARRWCFLLAGVGLFYGLFGVFRLGVTMDLVLVAGAAALALLTWLEQEGPLSRRWGVS